MRTRNSRPPSPIPSSPERRPIFAIDPGTEESQWLLWWPTGELTTEHVPNATLASALRKGYFDNRVVAIEMIASYGMPVGKEVFETCYYIGALMEICYQEGLKVLPVYRRDVKMALCGNAKAKDANVRQALIDIFGMPGTKKAPGGTYGISGHAWSALAIAWYAWKLIEPGC